MSPTNRRPHSPPPLPSSSSSFSLFGCSPSFSLMIDRPFNLPFGRRLYFISFFFFVSLYSLDWGNSWRALLRRSLESRWLSPHCLWCLLFNFLSKRQATGGAHRTTTLPTGCLNDIDDCHVITRHSCRCGYYCTYTIVAPPVPALSLSLSLHLLRQPLLSPPTPLLRLLILRRDCLIRSASRLGTQRERAREGERERQASGGDIDAFAISLRLISVVPYFLFFFLRSFFWSSRLKNGFTASRRDDRWLGPCSVLSPFCFGLLFWSCLCVSPSQFQCHQGNKKVCTG